MQGLKNATKILQEKAQETQTKPINTMFSQKRPAETVELRVDRKIAPEFSQLRIYPVHRNRSTP